MLAAKPLKQLLAEADALIKSASDGKIPFKKEAAAQDSEITALANLLAGADSEVNLETTKLSGANQEEIDKVAESLNRVQAAQEIEEFLKLAKFQEKAHQEGYSDEQIGEAFSKIAASKLSKSLPALVALGVIGFENTEDKNELPVKSNKKPVHKIDLTKSLGC